MKTRILSCLLICALVLGLCPAGALAAGETAEANGELRLVLNRAGAVAETEFIAQLTTQSGQPYREGRIQAAQGQGECALHMADIADGRYTLTLTAPGYVPYTQTLDFDGRCVQLTLYNYASVNEGRTQADGLFGVFPVGDVNGDKVIDDTDADAIVAAMDAQKPGYDLDGNGTVDLTDLAIAVRNAGGVRQATAVHTVSSKVLAKAVTPETAVGTATGSPLHELLDRQKEDTLVELAPVADEPISETNPVEVALPTSLKITAPEGSAEAAAQAKAATVQAEAIYIAAPAGSQSTIAAGTVTVEGVDQAGNNVTIDALIGKSAPAAALSGQAALLSAQLLADAPRDVSVEGDGSIIIDLGQRVAIKKVTIRVTKTADQGSLAQIAKVEFLSDFAERIPEPQLSIPTVQTVTNTESDGLGYKSLTVTWDPQPNVTGYELSVSGPGYNKTATATGTSHTFVGDSFNGTVKSFQTYQVKVRSVNGDWRSDWSAPYAHTVTCAKTPPAPQYLTATAAVQSLKVSWNCKFDAEWFTLCYKETTAKEYTKVEKLTASSYTIPNLTGGTRYTMYVVAHNRNGDSPKSQNAEGVPLTPTGVEMPKYKLLNVKDDKGGAMTHVTSITGNNSKPLTIFGGQDWTALMDNDPNSYLEIRDWDNGVSYGGFCGPEITLDAAYTFDTVRFSPFEGETVSQFDAKLAYWDEAGALQQVPATLSAKADALGRKYYEVVADRPITAQRFQLRTRTFNTAPITIAEIKIYQYDDLEHQVAALFTDDMRTTLKDTVTRAQINALVERTNTADPVSRELHPHREVILADLNYALELLEDTAKLAQVLRVDDQITANGNPKNGFAQALSDYQPLGFVAGAGDTVVLYVSDVDDKTPRGNYVNLNLIATQYHPQVAAWQKSVTRLKAGRNEVTIPKIGSDATERGGSLYLQYTGTRGGNHYDIRVSGATAIPALRLDGVTGAERTAAIKNYVNELEAYVGTLEDKHKELHANSTNANVSSYAYDQKNCFLNATEITLDNMMYSLPATQVWRALSGAADPAEQLANAIAAMEQQIDYFYQFKGLNRAATDADAYPFTRLNIRYHQMFTGAFMYAGGKHIGIEFGSAGGLFTLSPIVADETGKYVSGRLTGWGIAHEMGHCINAAAYQRVEVTNNVFAQLAKTGGGVTPESSANFRTSYQNVYKAVATGTTGHTGNLAVQLAQYWQLHLAYDNDYAYKTYDTIEAQQAGLFYARLESYLRDRTKAQPELPSASGGDQLFMQAACAAAGKDLLHFFTAWGFKPDAATRAYAANFPKESRKIQYIDDDSRLYRLEGKPGMSAGAAVTATIDNATDRRINGNRVQISLGNTNTNPDAMLGYEICRNGKVVAFVTADKTSYTDIVTTENNKAFTYTVTGIDRLLGETETLELEEVKVCHDGAIDKSGWRAQTNMVSPKDTPVEKNDNDPESGVVNGSATPGVETVSAITAALDNDPATVYCGKGSRPTITLDLGGVEQVAALKFTPAAEDYTGDAGEGLAAAADLYKYRLFGYKIEVSLDGATWETVKEGDAYTGSAANPRSWVKQSDVLYNTDGSYTLYFSRKNDDGGLDPFLYTYDAAYVRLTATNMSTLAVAELDVLGPTGDNVELIPQGFGRLSSAYKAGKHPDGTDCVIPTGAVVFYGAYKGDPAYNVVVLKDQNGKVLDGSQLIFAQVPEKGALGETSDGRWFFWLEDVEKTDDEGDKYNEMDQLGSLKRVKAELYRVQDAMGLTGQRLTSTALTMTLPETLPTITITADDPQAVAYVPDEAMVRAAMAGEVQPEELAEGETPQPEDGIYGDTGAGETGEASPVQLAGAAGSVKYTVQPAGLDMAARVDLKLDPAPNKATVQMDAKTGVYTARRYNGNTGELNLYAVARTGSFGEITLTGSVTGLDAKTTLSATALAGLDRLYALEETELKVSAPAQAGGSSSGNKPGSSGSSGGSSGGSSRPSGGGSGGSGGSGSSAAKTPFTDVEKGSWYEDAVKYVYDKGMMVGTADKTFSPQSTTSRAMIVTILWRLEGSPAQSAGEAFTDVAADQWYAAAVAWASEKAIVNGMGDGTFAPNSPITREQMAAILYRYAKYKNYATQVTGSLAAFTDAGCVSAYAVDALTWCNAKGLITGMGNNTLAPKGNATRAQAATIFYRLCTTIQK